MPHATVSGYAAAHSSIRACRTQVSEHATCAAVSEHAARKQHPSMPHTQVSGHAMRSSIRAFCRAQQYPGMPHASIRACCTQQYPSMLHTTYPGPCRAPAGCVPITTEYPSMPRETVSEHAAHASIRACRARQYPSIPCAAVSEHVVRNIKMAALHPAEFCETGTAKPLLSQWAVSFRGA